MDAGVTSKLKTSHYVEKIFVTSSSCFRSSEWRSVSDSDKEKLGLVRNDDGEFW